MTHQALIGHHTSAPRLSRNGIDLFREGAGESGAVLGVRPFEIVGLLGMIAFKLKEFFRLTQFLRSLQHIIDSNVEGAASEMGDGVDLLHRNLKQMDSICKEIGLELSALQVARIDHLVQPTATYAPMRAPLQQLDERILDEIEINLYLVVPKDRAVYYGKIDLFGPEVSSAYPSAAFDIEEAGNCYATDRNTACVFHLMRVLEKGLLALAADLKITFPVSISLENWQNIIEKIEAEIREINKQPKSVQKSEDLQFYSEAAKEFRYFKDAWRNHVSHSREKYGDAEAYRVLTHVRDFMQNLATRLKE